MSTATLNGRTNGSAYPRTVEELLPAARELARELGEVPPRNRLMRDFKIGVPKADALRDLLAVDAAGYESPTLPIPGEPAPVVEPAPAAPVVEPEPGPGADLRSSAVTDLRSSAVADSPEPGEVERGPVVVDGPEPAERSPQVDTPGHPGTREPEPVELARVKRVRWAVRAALALGVAASVAGNVLHARDELISQVISAWSPLALLITVELISRVPVHRRALAVARWAATALIAGIAAWVSYWHMAAVAARYGETNGSQYLLPLSVDGLVVVASICLVELGGRIAAASSARVTR